MRRRKVIAGGLSTLALGAGCLGILNTTTLPVYFENGSDKTVKVTAIVTNQNSGKEVFKETIEIAPEEEIERTLKDIKKGQQYLLKASSGTGETFKGEFNTTAKAIKLRVTPDGELQMTELVT